MKHIWIALYSKAFLAVWRENKYFSLEVRIEKERVPASHPDHCCARNSCGWQVIPQIWWGVRVVRDVQWIVFIVLVNKASEVFGTEYLRPRIRATCGTVWPWTPTVVSLDVLEVGIGNTGSEKNSQWCAMGSTWGWKRNMQCSEIHRW